ncbi:hypothetical protein [Roseobacter cerasinus]|nr:hypothetical protein [Roseobacter cerasinus]
MFDIDLEISLDHNPSHLESLGGFLFWPYGAYLEPTSDAISERQYIASVSALIADLRKRNLRVVASCDFEKEVSQITGWNWSEGSPIHPVH